MCKLCTRTFFLHGLHLAWLPGSCTSIFVVHRSTGQDSFAHLQLRQRTQASVHASGSSSSSSSSTFSPSSPMHPTYLGDQNRPTRPCVSKNCGKASVIQIPPREGNIRSCLGGIVSNAYSNKSLKKTFCPCGKLIDDLKLLYWPKVKEVKKWQDVFWEYLLGSIHNRHWLNMIPIIDVHYCYYPSSTVQCLNNNTPVQCWTISTKTTNGRNFHFRHLTNL